MAKKTSKKLRITQVKSSIGQRTRARKTLAALGLRRMHQTVLHADTPETRGMIREVEYLVKVEEAR